jgi:acetolactate synthase-1/3 small subunit
MMTADTLHLHIDRADGSLQRLIGLIERRGFHIDGMTLSDEGQSRRVQMAVRGRDEGRRSTACSASPAWPHRPPPSIPR